MLAAGAAAAAPRQGACVFDAEACVKCMLKKEEACAAGTNAGSGFCEREVNEAVAEEDAEADAVKKKK